MDLEDLGLHYTETLRRWRTNLERQRPAVHRLGFDEKFGRFPILYLPCSEAAFAERHVSDVQVVLSRPAVRRAAWAEGS